jgi:cysteinyl-tRNA synthetase
MIARLREERFDPDDPRKDDPLDILMWQAAAPGEPTWESPWGPGRPGWHIECTAMALRHLGNTIDVHGGGEDLIFSHHESERAQAESYTGARPFVRFWVYAGTVYAGQEKMSKSLRNLVLVRELLERYSGDAIRLYLAREHYRAHLTYEEAGLAEAAELVARLRAAAALAAPGEGPAPGSGEPPEVPPSDDFRARFEAAMDADLDTPGAVEVLRDLAAAVEVDRTSGVALARAMLLNELASVLGLRLAGQPGTVWPR